MSSLLKVALNNLRITYRRITSVSIVEKQDIVIYDEKSPNLEMSSWVDIEKLSFLKSKLEGEISKETILKDIKNCFIESFNHFEQNKDEIAIPKIEFSYLNLNNCREKIDFGPLLCGESKIFSLYKEFDNYIYSHHYLQKIHVETNIITPHFPLVVNVSEEIDEFSNSLVFSKDNNFHPYKNKKDDLKDFFLYNVSNLILEDPLSFSKDQIRYYINLCRRI